MWARSYRGHPATSSGVKGVSFVLARSGMQYLRTLSDYFFVSYFYSYYFKGPYSIVFLDVSFLVRAECLYVKCEDSHSRKVSLYLMLLTP